MNNKQITKKINRQIQKSSVIISLLILLALWTIFVKKTDIPSFILPSPIEVWRKFIKLLQEGVLFKHFFVTLSEVLLGLLFGTFFATILGYFLAKNEQLETIISPIIVTSQAIPTVAIAPLLIIWLGSGMISKILICSLIVFFPILTNTIVGIRSIPKDLYDLMHSLKATRWQQFKMLEVPGSTAIYLGGIRVGATLSVIGAVVGEFVGANQGLGFLINVGKGSFDTAMVFVAVFLLIGMALFLYGFVIFLENRFLKWQTAE